MDNLEKISNLENIPENILISNPEKLQEKIEKFKEGGAESIHVLADFDKTLTKAFLDGEKFQSVISLLRDGKHLTSDYAPKAQALFDKHHPYEIDLTKPYEERRERMNTWWKEHFELLIKSGLELKDLEDIVDSGKIKFRDGAKEFLNDLNQNNIPLLIISSNGVGNTIPMVFEKEGIMNPNIHIITNIFEFDENGKAVKVLKPTIHVMSKSEVAVKNYPVYKEVEDRRNVLLLGDSIDDIGMVEGFDFDEIIKIGFLNENVDKNKKEYLKNFDAVITNDGDMDYINELMEKLWK